MKNKIILFGTGEISELAYFYFTNDSQYEVVAFCCDKEYKKADSFCDLPLFSLEEIISEFPPKKYKMHVALSYSRLNQTRQDKYHQVKKNGYELVNYISSKSVYWNDLEIGDNCFILENQTIQPKVKIGNNVMIWSGNHLGHGCSIDDHTYLSSHICISGHTNIGKRCFIGVNSHFKDFINIGNDVVIAMGTSVNRDIDSGSCVIGSRSTIYSKDDVVTKKILKSYFKI
tara:strand:- start:25 stop:711 length:687 start_codon:yes stop_codon:yes gene_type:complete